MNKTDDKFFKRLVELEVEEFIGICKILGISLVEEVEKDGEKTTEAREFSEVLIDIADEYYKLNRKTKKDFSKLVSAAAKKSKK